MSEQVYVVRIYEDPNSSDPMEVIGVCRSVAVAQAMALEYFDDEEARVDTADPMHVFSGCAEAYIETFDLVG